MDSVGARSERCRHGAAGRLLATSRRLATFALMLVNALGVPASAADAMLNISISPEVAYQVREWRRAHGLAQAPEAVLPQAVTDGRGAIRQALRLIGIEDPSASGLRIVAVRVGAHWHVTIETPGEAPDYVVDVADSIASHTAL